MRVMMVNDYGLDEGWGAEIFLSRLVAGLRDAGEEVELFAGEIHPAVRGPFDVWDPRARKAVARAAARLKPDVIHHNNFVRRLTIASVGVPRGMPTVMTVHDLRLFGEPEGPRKPVRDAWYALRSRFERDVARRRVHVAMTYTDVVCRRLRSAGFRDVERIPGLVDAFPIKTVPVERATDVVFAGRLTLDKGVLVLAKAFARIAARHPDTRLVMAGEGPEGDAVRRTGESAGPGRVVLTGRLDAKEIRTMMATARVLVAPSIPSLRPEGANLTPMEAGILSRPSIVTDDPALREFVDRSGGGIVVKAGSVDELTAALERMLSAPDEAARVGARARELAVSEHTIETVVPKVVAAYRRAIETAARS